MTKLSIAIAGLGNVGQQVYAIAKRMNIPVTCVGDSSGWSVVGNGTDDIAKLKSSGKKLAQIGKVSKDPVLLPGTIVCDSTGSDQTVKMLIQAQAQGNGVVLANKKPITGSFQDFKTLTSNRNLIRISSTVGAGLPMLATLRRLTDSGDSVKKVQGAFSGTLGYIMTGLQQKRPFSEIVREAKKLGYTEPDPRDDLSGLDVGRKALIISRVLGSNLEMKDVKIEPLYPAAFEKLTVSEFMERLPELDQGMKERVQKSESKQCRLRYGAVVDEYGKLCSVGFVDAPADGSSALGNLAGTNNIMVIESNYYSKESGSSPLVIQGPGAGTTVTAAGMIADVLDLSGISFRKSWTA